MKWSGLLLWLSLLSDVFAAHGRLETLDGKKFQGQIRIAESGCVIANAVEEYVREVALTNVVEISFEPRRSFVPFSHPIFAANHPEELPAPWQTEQVGSGAVSGNAQSQAGVFTIKRYGADSQSEGNSRQFVYQSLDGDCEIVARVISIQKKDAQAIAGLMIRESLKPGARQVMVGLTGKRGGLFQWQEAAGEYPSEKLDPAMTVWYWLKLKRRENTFSGYQSRNGRDWGLIQTVDVPMNDKVFLGLVLNTRDEVRLTSAMFDNVRSGEFLVDKALVPKVEMRGGSVIAGHVVSADEHAVHFSENTALASVPTANVSRIVYRWLTPKMEEIVRGGRTGVLLVNGDFVEGGFMGIAKGRVKLSSILFGIRSFDVYDEVSAVILRKKTLGPFHYEIETWDKTFLRVDSIQPGMGEIIIRDAMLGNVRIPTEEISYLTRRK